MVIAQLALLLSPAEMTQPKYLNSNIRFSPHQYWGSNISPNSFFPQYEAKSKNHKWLLPNWPAEQDGETLLFVSIFKSKYLLMAKLFVSIFKFKYFWLQIRNDFCFGLIAVGVKRETFPGRTKSVVLSRATLGFSKLSLV